MTVNSAADRVERLIPKSPDTFVGMALTSATLVLRDQEIPLRLNLYCAAIRILFEHIMGTLAPTDDVVTCAWYEPVENQDKPVRAQRIQYWMQGGLSDAFLKDKLRFDPVPLRKRLVTAFNDLSKHVHGRENTFISGTVEIEAESAAIAEALEELFAAYQDYRDSLIKPLIEALDSEAVEALMGETIQAVDEIATHHSIDEIYSHKAEVEAITATVVRYRVSGTISVTLQWGSNSDLCRGDGAELDHSFPFAVSFEVPIGKPHDLSHAEVVSGVDTSSWWQGYYDPV